MRVHVFRGEQQETLSTADHGDLRELLRESGATLWVEMTGPSAYDLTVLREVFHFHPLAIEDTVNGRQRPKVEEYGAVLFAIMNPIGRAADGALEFRELDIFVGSNYLVTVHEAPEPCVAYALERIADAELRSLPVSPAYLLYVLVDKIVDDYFPILDQIEDQIDAISDDILRQPKQEELARLFELKRSLSEIWRITSQQRDMFSVLAREGSPYTQDGVMRYYLRDVQDHLIRIHDTVNTFRDQLSNVVDLYMSTFSNRLNLTVKRLAVLTLIIGLLTVISGFYGMNFERTWPPFEAPWGVPFVLTIMALGITALLLYVRRIE